MSTRTSPATGRRYPLTMVCAIYRVPRATVYAQTAVTVGIGPCKRGPRTPGTDEELVAAIRTVLATTPFHGEGHRKVRVRLRPLGWHVGKNRVLRLMRAQGCWRARIAIRMAIRPMPGRSRPAAERDVGHGCDAVLHRARGLVLVLRGDRPRE